MSWISELMRDAYGTTPSVQGAGLLVKLPALTWCSARHICQQAVLMRPGCLSLPCPKPLWTSTRLAVPHWRLLSCLRLHRF